MRRFEASAVSARSQRLAQVSGLGARAHCLRERQRLGLRLAHVGGTEEAGREDREHGDRMALQVRPPVAVVRRQHRCDQHQQRADRRDQRDVPVLARRECEHDGEQVADADRRVEHVGDVDGEDRRAHHQQPRQEIAAAVQVAAQAVDDRVASLFLGHPDDAAQVVAQAEGAEQQQRHEEVADGVDGQIRLPEEPADRRAFAFERQVEQQQAVGAIAHAIEKMRVTGNGLEVDVRPASVLPQPCGCACRRCARGLMRGVRRERVLQVRSTERGRIRVERLPTCFAGQDRFGDGERLGHGDVGAEPLRNDFLLLQERRADDRQEQHQHQDRHDRRLACDDSEEILRHFQRHQRAVRPSMEQRQPARKLSPASVTQFALGGRARLSLPR